MDVFTSAAELLRHRRPERPVLALRPHAARRAAKWFLANFPGRVLYAAKANDAPEKLDLERHPNRHIAFGTGIHFCLGYQLARLEGKCALKALFGRWPKLALAIDPATVRWRKHPGLKAIETLPVRPEAA